MHFRVIAAALLWMMLSSGLPLSAAADDSATRYISDETAITLRADKGMNAAVAALLKSGAKVELIEDDTASGYSRVKVSPGREGWVLTRYLSNEPAARERLVAVQSKLAEQQAMVRKLEGDVIRLREAAVVSGNAARPAVDPAPASAQDPAPGQGSDPVLVGTGIGLFVAGLLSGLLIPMLRRGKPRRRAGAAA